MSTAIYAMTSPDTPLSDEDAIQIASIISLFPMTHDDLTQLRCHLEDEPLGSRESDVDLWYDWHNTLLDQPGWSILADIAGWAEVNIWRLAHNHHAAIDCCLHLDPHAETTTDPDTIYSVLKAVHGDSLARQLTPFIGYLYWG